MTHQPMNETMHAPEGVRFELIAPCVLDDPAAFDDVKAAGLVVSGDDFDVDAEVGAVFDRGVLKPVSTQVWEIVRKVFFVWLRSHIPMALPDMLAPVTITARIRPSASMTTPRLQLTIFFPPSMPWLVNGTLVDVFTLWVSMTHAVRSALTRARPVRL
jgi:hypothetical protein